MLEEPGIVFSHARTPRNLGEIESQGRNDAEKAPQPNEAYKLLAARGDVGSLTKKT